MRIRNEELEAVRGFDRALKTGREAGGGDFPDREDAPDIAAAWGIDPGFGKNTDPPSTGWLCVP